MAFRQFCDEEAAMLVIVSDLHLTDGSSGETTQAGAFEIFAERLRDMAISASWRADGGYRPIEQIDVVLLGDVLDLIRSTRWNQHDGVRPWSNPHAPELFQLVRQITTDVLAHNHDSLESLKTLAGENGVVVPPADGRGNPVYGVAGQPVPVRIHYMVGNHDWFFHLPGAEYNGLRKTVIEALGLVNAADEPFPHEPAESGLLLEALRRHRVFARHGDVFDPFNFEGDRDASSLGDALVVELLNRFSGVIETQLAEDLPEAALLALRELDNVRPMLLIPVWIDGVLERTCSFPALRKQVKKHWDELADRFLNLNFVRQRDTWNPNDIVDGLQQALLFSKRLSIRWASTVVQWLHSLRGAQDESYYSHALNEPDFRNRRARHIVYGHTHYVEHVPLDASYAEGYTLNQMYFNSGTWRRVHQQTQLAPAEHEFIASDVMTYLSFFQADERGGRPYETWSGMLGVAPASSTVHRIDRGRRMHAAGESIPAPTVHGHGPHFAAAARQTGRVARRGK